MTSITSASWRDMSKSWGSLLPRFSPGPKFSRAPLEVTTTFTTRTFTYTIIPGDCPLPLTDVSQSALDCLSKTPGCLICDGGRESGTAQSRDDTQSDAGYGFWSGFGRGSSLQKPELLR